MPVELLPETPSQTAGPYVHIGLALAAAALGAGLVVSTQASCRLEDMAGTFTEWVRDVLEFAHDPERRRRMGQAARTEMRALADELGKLSTGPLGKALTFAHCEGPAEAIAMLGQFGLANGDAVLVKGSNSVGLGRLVSHFT